MRFEVDMQYVVRFTGTIRVDAANRIAAIRHAELLVDHEVGVYDVGGIPISEWPHEIKIECQDVREVPLSDSGHPDSSSL